MSASEPSPAPVSTAPGRPRGRRGLGTSTNERRITALTGASGWKWLSAVSPTKDDLEKLVHLGFRREDLLHALDPKERPRVRCTNGSVLVVLRAVVMPAKRSSAPMTTLSFGILLSPEQEQKQKGGHGLVISTQGHKLLDEITTFIERTEHADSANSAHRVVLYALEVIASDYLRRLAHIEETVDRIEERLQKSLGNAEVLALLRHQKSLMHFTVALEEMHVMLEHVEKVVLLRPTAEDEPWLEDVRVEVRQALETSRLSSDVLSQMMDAFASIISNNLNVVMKFLASVTLILTLPILISSFYGMNVKLPGQASHGAFAFLIVLSLILCTTLAVVLRRRRWL